MSASMRKVLMIIMMMMTMIAMMIAIGSTRTLWPMVRPPLHCNRHMHGSPSACMWFSLLVCAGQSFPACARRSIAQNWGDLKPGCGHGTSALPASQQQPAGSAGGKPPGFGSQGPPFTRLQFTSPDAHGQALELSAAAAGDQADPVPELGNKAAGASIMLFALLSKKIRIIMGSKGLVFLGSRQVVEGVPWPLPFNLYPLCSNSLTLPHLLSAHALYGEWIWYIHAIGFEARGPLIADGPTLPADLIDMNAPAPDSAPLDTMSIYEMQSHMRAQKKQDSCVRSPNHSWLFWVVTCASWVHLCNTSASPACAG